jgi:tRNA (cmo5U34)-methyltransferase
MNVRDFSFGEHAAGFDEHIEASIPGYLDLRDLICSVSPEFIQPGTGVVDIGCSTGAVLRRVRDENQGRRPAIQYVGVDYERAFARQWAQRHAGNIRFELADARSFDGFANMSLAISLFTLQFIPEQDRLPLLRRLYDGLVEGGGLIIGEKVLASNARFQDMLTSAHYAFKRRAFRPHQILDKGRSLRGQMILWSEEQWINTLCQAGFQAEEIQRFWQSHLFIAMVARKTTWRAAWSTLPAGRVAA